jgi:putative flippase GtrA
VEIVRQYFGKPDTGLWISRELFRYLSVGVANMAVGLSTIYLCMYVLHAADLTANVIGYCAGVICSFVLNRRWTFASKAAWLPELVRFLVVLGIAYAANILTVLGLINQLGTNRYLAQALGTIPYTAIGYIGSRLFAFRR